MPKHIPSPTRARTTVPLTGTASKSQALLDHKATISLAFAGKVVSKALRLTVPASGITRRAVGLYANRLSTLDPEQLKREAYAVRDGCKAFKAPPEDTKAALALLDDADSLPSLERVLNGNQQPIDWDAFHDQVEATVTKTLSKRREK